MNSTFGILDPTVARAVRFETYRAWRSLRRYGFEPKDVRQEFYVTVVRNHRVYDPQRASPETFVSHLCRYRTLQLVEGATSGKRGGGVVPRSLSEPVELGKRSGTTCVAELSDIISDDGVAIRMGRRSRSADELMALRIDVGRVVGGLPAKLAAVARLLAEGESMTEAARRLGISRATVHRRVVRLREEFRWAGLDPHMGWMEAA